MSIQAIYEAVGNQLQKKYTTGPVKHLDVGAGRGGLIKFLNGKFAGMESFGCDYDPTRMNESQVENKRVDLDKEKLPYADATFDWVTCTEVLEHVENYRAVMREIYRVLKPGGVAVFTTPNVLNALSRWRNLLTGFANLFGPLPVKNDARYSTGGHITPLPYFYMAHGLLDSDFTDVEMSIDKVNKGSLLAFVPIYPLILLNQVFFWLKEENRYKTITPENRKHVEANFSVRILVGRTIVVSARKK